MLRRVFVLMCGKKGLIKMENVTRGTETSICEQQLFAAQKQLESAQHSLQQLKAEIAAKCNHALNPSYAFSNEQLLDMFRELRQLSAV